MTLCKDIQSFSRRHERIADFFSLLAVASLFALIWASLTYHELILHWVRANPLLRGALLIGGLVGAVALIMGLLAVGSSRFGEEGERCFGTFAGRRSGASPVAAFRNWLDHMENVGKRHR